MKKTQKQILGCFGLGLVAATTVVAALMPLPNASATTTITDTIQVRVVGDTPKVGVSSTTVAQESTVTAPSNVFTTTYENVKTLKFSLSYTNEAGETTIYNDIFDELDADYYAGSIDNTLDLSESRFNINNSLGYGYYVLTATGIGYSSSVEYAIEFTYAPLQVSAEQNPETGRTVDVDISDVDTDNVGKIVIKVDGEEKKVITGDDIASSADYQFTPEKPFADSYKVEVEVYDTDGNLLYRKEIIVKFDATLVPDTGRFFQGLNISSEDYLVTGLIAFFVVGVVGIGIITRNHKTTKKTSKRR